MDKIEFNQRMQLINNVRKEANFYREEASRLLSIVNTSVSNICKNLEERENQTDFYLKALEEFSYSDQLTAPSDLFPGIRTASEMADPNKLKKKAEDMKTAAAAVNASTTLIDLQAKKAQKDLKDTLANYTECIIRYNQLYDLEMQLVNDMDSIYDVGNIARNT